MEEWKASALHRKSSPPWVIDSLLPKPSCIRVIRAFEHCSAIPVKVFVQKLESKSCPINQYSQLETAPGQDGRGRVLLAAFTPDSVVPLIRPSTEASACRAQPSRGRLLVDVGPTSPLHVSSAVAEFEVPAAFELQILWPQLLRGCREGSGHGPSKSGRRRPDRGGPGRPHCCARVGAGYRTGVGRDAGSLARIPLPTTSALAKLAGSRPWRPSRKLLQINPPGGFCPEDGSDENGPIPDLAEPKACS